VVTVYYIKTIQTPYIHFFTHGAIETSFNTRLNRTFVRCEAGFNPYMLPDALLFDRRCILRCQAESLLCGGEKNKKKKVAKKFFLGGRKKYSLKKIACSVGLCVF